MRVGMQKALAWLCLSVPLVQARAADPPTGGFKVLGPALTAPGADKPVPVPSGRFVPIQPLSGKPIYLADDRAYRVYVVPPGSAFTGIKWDAPADAEPEPYSWPDAKTPVYVVLARGYLGTYKLQPIVNGDTAKDPPKPDGSPLTIEVVRGPPGPTPPPPPPPPPPVDPVLTPFQVKLQAAFHADGATADSKAKYAALWRNAAKTTVYDPGLVSPKAVLDELQAAVKLLGIPAGTMNKTARAVADEINPLMPTPAAGLLTQQTRDGMAAIFSRIANDLEVIK